MLGESSMSLRGHCESTLTSDIYVRKDVKGCQRMSEGVECGIDVVLNYFDHERGTTNPVAMAMIPNWDQHSMSLQPNTPVAVLYAPGLCQGWWQSLIS